MSATMNEIQIEDIQYLELFQDLALEDVQRIAPYFSKRQFKRHEGVYSSSHLAQHFMFVITGKIKIYRLSQTGKEQIIRSVGAHEFTGELALFEHERKAYASALEPSVVYMIDYHDLKSILKSYPDIALKMIEILAYRLQLSEEQTSWVSTVTAKDRLWMYLNRVAQMEDHTLVVRHKETKRFLAAYLGMTSETLSRMLFQLEAEGRIRQYSETHLEILP